MKALLDRLHAKLGDLWWYSLMIFIACRSGDVIQAFIGLWLVPKYVGPDELGAVLPLQQLSNLFAVPLAVLATVFAKYVNTYATRGEYGKVKSFIHDVLWTACGVFLICIAVAYLVIPHFYVRLNVASGMLTILILVAGFASNIANLFTAALQGLKKFKTMTIQNLISAPIRLATLLVAMPIRALSGYILGQATPPATCSLLAAWSLHKDLKSIPIDTSWRKDLPEIWRYLWPIGIYMVFTTLLGTIHSSIFRQRLPAVESAAYYMLSRFAEIAGYFGTTLMIVLFPLASEAAERGSSRMRILQHTIFGTLGSTIIIATIFSFCSEKIFSILSEWSDYKPYAGLLPVITLSAGLQSLVFALIVFGFAARRFLCAMFFIATNLIFVAFLISFTGYEFFRGCLADAIVNWMGSFQIARLSVLVNLTFTILLLETALFSIITYQSTKKAS